MSINPTKFIWMDGELVPWEEAKVHLLTHTLHYGYGVFEGIRCYKTSRGPAIFRLKDHMERLRRSAEIVGMKLPYSVEELIEAAKLVVRENGLEECYIRPIAYCGYGVMGLSPRGAPVRVAIAAWRWGTYLGEEGLKNGVRVKISPYRRIHPSILPPHAKLVANYANSILAKLDALDNGYDEALMLNLSGNVSEGPGENIFIVERGVLITPPISECALPGITRDSVLQLAMREGIPAKEEPISPERLYKADEAFFTGTAAEVTPIREVEGRPIGKGTRGEITARLQELYFRVVRGEEKGFEHWLDWV
ncbi:MAG: branched chain amino acid aminotransferase [Hadesarchaea archaeon]|nr:MAG: branched chain amino acid aminotransferase [Hadesarchaea archaeon]